MQRLLDLFRPGRTIYLPGASGEALALSAALAREPDRMDGVHVASCLLPGLNQFDYAGLHANARVTCFLLPPALRASFELGRVRVLPVAYSEAARRLSAMACDVAVAHVAPPNARGLCSLGIAADFTPLVWPRARVKVLLINSAMPAIAGAPHLALNDADIVIEVEAGALVTKPADAPDATLDVIARRVAALVPDGAAVQTGIGGAPSRVWSQLHAHKNLVIASGITTDAVEAAARAGALNAGARHVTGIALGDMAYYATLAEQHLLSLEPVTRTHDVSALSALNAFTAINSALEVDLFGQANLEWRDGLLSSGVGGAPDFANAAVRAPGGRSILALPATAKGGAISRIVARVDTPTVSLSRDLIDTVVTEHGVAELRDRSLDERAEALIAIAAPNSRDALTDQWRELRRRL